MYNNDLYNIIITESRHIQDAINNSGGGGGGTDPALLSNVAAITADVDDLNTCLNHFYCNRFYAGVFHPSDETENRTSIASAFSLPADGLQERLYYVSLFAASSNDGRYEIDLQRSINVFVNLDSGVEAKINDSQATFSPSLPLSRDSLNKINLFSGSQVDTQLYIIGLFNYSTKSI